MTIFVARTPRFIVQSHLSGAPAPGIKLSEAKPIPSTRRAAGLRGGLIWGVQFHLVSWYLIIVLGLYTHRIHGAAIYGNIYHPYTPNVSIYTIHGSYGIPTKVNFEKHEYNVFPVNFFKPNLGSSPLRHQSSTIWLRPRMGCSWHVMTDPMSESLRPTCLSCSNFEHPIWTIPIY